MTDDKRHPMDGKFIGGGMLEHVIHEGEVYINIDKLITLFGNTGLVSGSIAMQEQDEVAGAQAILLIHLTQSLQQLRSELLKQEAEKLYNL